MEALDGPTGYVPEYVQLTLGDKSHIWVRKENRALLTPPDADALAEADWKLYGDFDDAA